MTKPEYCILNNNKIQVLKAAIICRDLSLPIQAIIQAAFFSRILAWSTVACSCFITRKRLHIHIDICEANGEITILHLLTLSWSVNSSESIKYFNSCFANNACNWSQELKQLKQPRQPKQRNASTWFNQATNYILTGSLKQSRILTWSDLFIKGDIRPLVKLKHKNRMINVKEV